MDTRRLERVLIIKPSSLGDIIHALPVAAAIKAAHPGAIVDWVAARQYKGLLEGHPAIERVITFDRGMLKGPGRASRLLSFLRELRRERYTVVIDLQGLLRSALMAFACRADERAGFANAREGAPLFYGTKVPVPAEAMHAVDRYMLIPHMLGINGEDAVFTINTTPEQEREAVSLLREAGIGASDTFVAIAPSARWETKRWPAGNFVEVANRLYEGEGIKSVFVGTSEEESVLAGHAVKLKQKGGLLFGKTDIKTLAALLHMAGAVLTNDSGPMHIAAAVGTPTVAVFGPTDPRLTGPYGDKHRIIAAGDDCAPCFKRDCAEVKCLAGITPGEVYIAVMDALGSRR